MEELNLRQEEILDKIKRFIAENGYPPTVRELCKIMNMSSPASIQYHIENLEKKGYIKKKNSKTRTMELLVKNEYINNKETIDLVLIDSDTINPIEKIKKRKNIISIPSNLISKNNSFALIVKKEMKEINIGDIVLIEKTTYKDGDIIALLNNNKINLEVFSSKNKKDNQILGKAVSLYRKL